MKPTFTGLALAIAVLALGLPLGERQVHGSDSAYSNPVVAGDYPDPSVIRVGKVYWATATSSEWGPPFPILRSRDLVNWEVVGSVFKDRPDWAVANFWAPEIQAWRGRYYVYYVARKRGGPLAVAVASADEPEGPYTDHGPIVAQEAGSIDPVACDDENGRRYLIWKEDGNSRRLPTIMWAAPLNEDGTKLIGEPKELFRNDAPWEGAVVEGAFVVRRNGEFFLFYSGNGCCGSGCNYALGVARSRALLGPWRKHPQNPILKGNDAWRCPGHGSIVRDPQGRDWLLYHAYDAQDFVFTGRQAMLDEVTWGADGWPSINGGQGPSVQAASPFGRAGKQSELRLSDAFGGSALKPGWNWPIAWEPGIGLQRGKLVLESAAGRTNDLLGGVLGRSFASGDFEATTAVEARALRPGVFAGLAAVGDTLNAAGIACARNRVVVWYRVKGQHRVLAETVPPPGPRWFLRLTATRGRDYRFAFSGNGRDWTPLGDAASGQPLPPWDRAVRVAVTVGGQDRAQGRFDFLRVEPVPPGR